MILLKYRQINKAKFISGANLCINLTDAKRVFPFYNPPGARGEDTFLKHLFEREKSVACSGLHIS